MRQVRNFQIEEPTLPPSLDPKLLKRFYRELQEDRKRAIQAEYKAFLDKAEAQNRATAAMLDLLKLDGKRRRS